MHHYEIIQKEKLIVLNLKGEIHLKDFLGFFKKLCSDPAFDSDHATAFDFRKARIMLSLEELKEMAKKYLKADCFKGRKALLVNRSVDTAKIMIFRDHVGLDQRFCVYSTVEGASSFLQNDLSHYLDEEDSVREDVYIDYPLRKTISSDAHLRPSSLS